MPFPTDHYDPEAALMRKAFDAAWQEVGFALTRIGTDPTAVHTLMSVSIMAAVRDGERDPNELKELALEAIVKAYLTAK